MRGGCHGRRSFKGTEVAHLPVFVLVQESSYDGRSHNCAIGSKITARTLPTSGKYMVNNRSPKEM